MLPFTMVFNMKPKFIFYFLIFNFSFLIEATATIRYVSKTGSSSPPYTSWATASDCIQKVQLTFAKTAIRFMLLMVCIKKTLVVNQEIALIGSSMDSTVIDGLRIGGQIQLLLMLSASILNFTYKW